MRGRCETRSGFTLIEVLLAIALSAVLMSLLVFAIGTYLQRVDASRGVVEQAQVARGVLRVIAEDIRNVAIVYEQDTSSAQAAAASQALFDVDQADQEPVEESETEESTRTYVGVNGQAQAVQVDVLRIRPAYVLSTDQPDAPITMGYDSPGITGVRYSLAQEGLVRQQSSRDIAIFEEQRGLTDSWDASARVIASEVADLRFRYHDGTQLLDYWDMEEQQGASPLAIQVQIGLRDPHSEEDAKATTQPLRYYRMTVPLPTPPDAEEATEEEEETTEESA